MKRLIVYGDLHGCLQEFQALRESLNLQEGDREVCVGDIITKGPHSVKLLRYIQEMKIEAVVGNHEDRIIRYLKHAASPRQNPMHLNSDEADIVAHLKDDDAAYLSALPLFIRVNGIVILHGGIQNSMDLDQLSKRERQKVMRLRYVDPEGHFVGYGDETETSIFWSEVYDGSQGFVVYGHQPFRAPKADASALGIDTGCVYGHRLSAAIFDLEASEVTYRIVSVPAQQMYYESQSFV